MQLRPTRTSLVDQIEKIALITVFWTIISVFQFFTGYTTLLELNCDLSGLSPWPFFQGSLLTGLVGGLTGGGLIVFLWSNWLRTRSYGWALMGILASYTIVFLIVHVVNSFFTDAQTGRTDGSIQQIASPYMLSSYLYWLMIVLITLVALLVNDKYGPGVFRSFMLGRYFHAKREARIFMFLDLRGSTTIAEQLGERRYFNFLKDVFSDATPGILSSKGEIYQYVGDEIVISWKEGTGVQGANCLQCYFNIQQLLLDRSSYYIREYDGIKPEFKAGLHYGHVMIGEIGIVKRDIAYSGDVLNTTARIQAKCNELGVGILLSGHLLEKLGAIQDLFRPIKIGSIALRGRQEPVTLYTV
jgi:adenylate cyclase